MSQTIAADARYFAAPPGLAERLLAGSDVESAPPRWRRLPRQWMAVAAAMLPVALLSAGLTYYVTGLGAQNVLEQEIVAGHVRSLMANHLTDVTSTDQHTVKPWFNGKLDVAPPVRDLSAEGFPLVGGRLDYLAGHSVAALVYKRREHTINVFVWPEIGARASAPTMTEHQGYHLLHWTEAGTVFWEISDVNPQDLRDLQTLLAANGG